ncbi:hypothetical protein BCR37DRAFT_384539 [Protomyces lactucae-debilis]|uniref:Uncharacterized protein n=1 Tax=Protomyces lactucae-debilis TaxID=2754530 RepID=A0A1Y2ER89_PROLT|nr:uncharacterized protein BCR37DRAFT_384539 [Protomyces lactucae-debilis]ORY74111.1 hypothetical protein BCR37DRAFT_384539 [Protomyces lactucae-debilis]
MLKPRPALPRAYFYPQNALTANAEDENEPVFPVDLDDVKPVRRLNYKQSCPALMGTASRLFAEQPECQMETQELPDLRSLMHSEERAIQSRSPLESLDCMQPPIRTLRNKRSILLADIIDDVEGRPPRKRLDQRRGTASIASAVSVDSIDIVSGPPGPQPLRPKASQFDLLYQSSKALSSSAREKPVSSSSRDQKPPEDLIIERQIPSAQLEPRRGRALRPAVSLLSMRVAGGRSASPAKRRLEDIDTGHITSFDALLPPVAPEGSDATMHDASPPDTQMRRSMRFARNTKLLMELPPSVTNMPPRRLRHAKSAKDILRKYAEPRQEHKTIGGGISKTIKQLLGFNKS